jgi:hypothetical protein
MDHSVGDTTDLLPRVAAARRNFHIGLTVLVLMLLGVVALLALRPPTGRSKVPAEASAAVDAEAKRLAVIFDATIKAAHVQADNMAAGTQIRAGIMTDAATVKDLVTSEIQLPRNLNQTLELVQLMDAQRNVLLRMPDGAPPVPVTHAMETRFEVDGRKELAVIVAAPVAPVDNTSQITGELVLSTPLDFAVTRDNLGPHATAASIVVGSTAFPVLGQPGTAGMFQSTPIPLDANWHVGRLALAIAVGTVAAPASWVVPVKLLCGGLALAFALVLAISLYRNRDP